MATSIRPADRQFDDVLTTSTEIEVQRLHGEASELIQKWSLHPPTDRAELNSLYRRAHTLAKGDLSRAEAEVLSAACEALDQASLWYKHNVQSPGVIRSIATSLCSKLKALAARIWEVVIACLRYLCPCLFRKSPSEVAPISPLTPGVQARGEFPGRVCLQLLGQGRTDYARAELFAVLSGFVHLWREIEKGRVLTQENAPAFIHQTILQGFAREEKAPWSRAFSVDAILREFPELEKDEGPSQESLENDIRWLSNTKGLRGAILLEVEDDREMSFRFLLFDGRKESGGVFYTGFIENGTQSEIWVQSPRAVNDDLKRISRDGSAYSLIPLRRKDDRE